MRRTARPPGNWGRGRVQAENGKVTAGWERSCARSPTEYASQTVFQRGVRRGPRVPSTTARFTPSCGGRGKGTTDTVHTPSVGRLIHVPLRSALLWSSAGTPRQTPFARKGNWSSRGEPPPRGRRISYLVDPASSHMLVSKIKPCMSKYRPKQGETANGSLNQLWFIGSYPFLLG